MALEKDSNNFTISPYFQYTVSPHNLGGSLVVAVQTDEPVSESIPDLFDIVAVLLPSHASRLIDGVAKSSHAKDFYSNPLELALDSNRKSAWRISGNQADFTFTFNQGRFEYLNEYAITATELDIQRPVSWVVRGCFPSSDEVSGEVNSEANRDANCDVLDVRQDEKWLGAFQTRVFAMNGRARSYRSYRIDFGGHCPALS